MAHIRRAFIVFHYAEKIKTNLIIASNLLESLDEIKGVETTSAEKLLTAYFNAVIVEVNIAANAAQIEGFKDVASKLKEATEQIRQHNYDSAQTLVSEAISITTTHGSRAAQTLKEENLI